MENKGRDFIQETIDTLSRASKNIDIAYTKFKVGNIGQEEFERQYHHILADNVFDTLEAEIDCPNNGCPYLYITKK